MKKNQFFSNNKKVIMGQKISKTKEINNYIQQYPEYNDNIINNDKQKILDEFKNYEKLKFTNKWECFIDPPYDDETVSEMISKYNKTFIILMNFLNILITKYGLNYEELINNKNETIKYVEKEYTIYFRNGDTRVGFYDENKGDSWIHAHVSNCDCDKIDQLIKEIIKIKN